MVTLLSEEQPMPVQVRACANDATYALAARIDHPDAASAGVALLLDAHAVGVKADPRRVVADDAIEQIVQPMRRDDFYRIVGRRRSPTAVAYSGQVPTVIQGLQGLDRVAEMPLEPVVDRGLIGDLHGTSGIAVHRRCCSSSSRCGSRSEASK
jgi:hypothetical protein